MEYQWECKQGILNSFYQYKRIKNLLTNWLEGDVSAPVPSAPNIIKGLEELPLWGKAGIEITSPGVWVEGVEGAELGEGPAVFAVPELLAGPEDETGCFLFLPVWLFEPLKYAQKTMLGISHSYLTEYTQNEQHLPFPINVGTSTHIERK